MIYNHVKKNKVCFLRCLEGAAGLIVTLSTVKSYAHKMWSVTFAVKFHLSFENFDVISMVSMRVPSPSSKMDIFCPFYRGVCLIEVSVKRELTV